MKKSAKALIGAAALIYAVFFAVSGVTIYFRGRISEDSSSYLYGFASGLGAVAIAITIKLIVMKFSPKYRKKQEIELNDERNKTIRTKTNALSFAFTIIYVAAASIYLIVTGDKTAGMILTFVISASTLTNGIIYMILSKKG